jgi:hypothetical protein
MGTQTLTNMAGSQNCIPESWCGWSVRIQALELLSRM